MEPSPSRTVPSDWGITARTGCRYKTQKSARAGLWKRREVEKSKSRLSHLAWKSRKVRGIPTFPQPRRLLAINRNRTFHLLLNPDILICHQQYFSPQSNQISGTREEENCYRHVALAGPRAPPSDDAVIAVIQRRRLLSESLGRLSL